MPHIVFLYATAPDPQTAASLARTLVEERLIACGNVLLGLRSVYRWEGAVTEESEAALLCKTTADRADAALARLAELHPYEVPAISRFDAANALPAFAAWIADEVTSRSSPPA
ncbi:divalent-cation tolerance protein CutA [Alienimonas californiensis]|uniref:Divalent-cation tolerance protein CutA n=1 Tax=Alienimonas californiensis TaxID=2527989 RepID=A0A517PC37_9PLAN|nr:divalent-cation tolerance protein CutA [Alienimonas californiensis]QDT16943.1 Divalent-cation tolerance protein CutA [Alienimonas californiensis]